jgi:hypothetical protein
MKKLFYEKGDRIRARWLEANTGCLSGSGLKFAATERTLTGLVRHVRGDHPTHPTSVRVYVDPDSEWEGKKAQIECTCGHRHVELRPEWVVEVL